MGTHNEEQHEAQRADSNQPEVIDESGAGDGKRRGGMSEALLEFMKTGWDDPDDHSATALPNTPRHAERRARLSALFAGETLVIPTGQLVARSNDTDYDFRPGTEFVYLTGFYEDGAVLILAPATDGELPHHHAQLFIRPRASRQSHEFFASRDGELWVGPRPTLRSSSIQLGVTCADIAELPDLLASLEPASTRVLRGYDVAVDNAVALTEDGKRDAELATELSEFRLVKDEWELTQLQNAVDATIRGFEDVVRALPADRTASERLVDGVFGFRARHDGNFVGYGTIAAAGAHACTLHWVRNDGITRPGELLLVDAGVENKHFYTADVTRTLPINGRFTPLQRRVYDIVYAAQQAGFAAVKPSAQWTDVHLSCMRVLVAGLFSLGVLTSATHSSPADILEREDERYRRWTLHGFGHMLGLDVHDCAHARNEIYRSGELKPGYVLTVEPGLYFQPDDQLVPAELRGIGVRIEDDVVVTNDGCRILSDALPRQADELEAWMAEQRAAEIRLPG